MTARVSTDDLYFAADWLREYDDHPDNTAEREAALRVAAWIAAEVKRREFDARVRSMIVKAGGDPSNAEHRRKARKIAKETFG